MEFGIYSLSFTTGAALINESVIVAKLYTELRQWPDVRCRILEENAFQTRTLSTLKKLYGEVSKRLKHLTDAELNMLSKGVESQVKVLVWLAICRQYKFIKDFALEVIAPQYESARYLLTHDDYDAFFNSKAEWHRNLDEATTQTKSKARQVLFKIVRECGLIDDDNEIHCIDLDNGIKKLITNNLPDDFQIFPGAKEYP